MAENGTVAYVSEFPKCDICKANNKTETIAKYDGKLAFGSSWGYMCIDHFVTYGSGLGTGRGQELKVRD
jgi:hypothetical protein